MAEIALMICVVSSLSASVGGGFYLFKKEQENTAKEELIAEKKAVNAVTGYFECDYKGEDSIVISDDGETTPPRPIKSIIVPAGFSVDTYSEENQGGVKITLGGPSDQKCTTIKSMVVTKV
jgi:flagellar basal body-associated protein FliL